MVRTTTCGSTARVARLAAIAAACLLAHVTVDITYAAQYTMPFVVAWDCSGGTGQGLSEQINADKIDSDEAAAFATSSVVLDRARFAGQGSQGADFAPNMTIAHSAPIYVVVDDEPTWNREQAPAIVAELRTQLDAMLTEPVQQFSTNPWETRIQETEQWPLQRPMLKPQVARADAAYAAILDAMAKFPGAKKP